MPISGKMLALHYNIAREAAVTASTELSGAEAAYVQTIDPQDAWRATGKTAEYVQFDFGAPVPLTHAAAVWHNLDTQGAILTQVSDDPTFNPVNDVWNSSDLEAWEPVAGMGFDGFGSSLGGYPILNDRNDYRPIRVIDMGGTRLGRYARMTFKNPTNAGITGVACGHVFFGLGDNLTRNFSWGWMNTHVDPSDKKRTEGTLRIKKRPKYQVLEVTPNAITENENNSWWGDFKRTIGSSDTVILVLFPNAAAPKKGRTTIYGVPADSDGTSQSALDVYASKLRVEELRAPRVF